MGVRLKRQRNGSFRPFWYGEFQDAGNRREINLNLRWKGTPPESGSLREMGDTRFESSRKEAEKALEMYVNEARHKGRAEHLTELLIESKTGRSVDYMRVIDLPESWRNLGRETPVTNRYLVGCDARFRRFIDFMQTRNPSVVYLYEVSPKDTAAFVTDLRMHLARSSEGATVRLLNKAFERFLPVGAANPFSDFVGNRGNGKGETIHRKPFSPDELKAILDAARYDEFLYPLITAAACTGLRRGDVCTLRWRDVDLDAAMLTIKASKTESPLEIPIFKPLQEVLEERKGNRSKYVFPAAARMLRDNPNGLTWRFKKVVARALAESDADTPQQLYPIIEIEAAGVAAIEKNISDGARRSRMTDTLRLYCAGRSYRQISESKGYAQATISTDLHAVEDMIGKPFLRTQSPSVKKAVRETTQAKREKGQRAASVRDWHALRSTFVTLALAAGVPVELVRRATGHATVAVVLQHYFRPDREQFRAALTDAMPGILTGSKQTRMKPAEELTTLAEKLATGNGTKRDKARLMELAARLTN